MGLLVNGKWQAEDITLDKPSSFNGALGTDTFPAEAGRYHLYIAHSCPFAHRAMMMLKLKGLDKKISWSAVAPSMSEGWDFDADHKDPLFGKQNLHELYTMADSTYSGRVTVPLLWDKKTNTAVNNESAELMRIFNTAYGVGAHDYYPKELQTKIDAFNNDLGARASVGVYKVAFATTQADYEEALYAYFDALEELDDLLATQRYAVGDTLTEADIKLFSIFIRFEPVYHNLFKANLQHLWAYENIWNYMKELYQIPEIQETVNFEEIKTNYYRYFKRHEPNAILPVGPVFDLTTKHNRDKISPSAA